MFHVSIKTLPLLNFYGEPWETSHDEYDKNKKKKKD